MEKIEFSKYNGQGNDFVIIDAVNKEITLSSEQIIFICNRHFGIGADGLILVKKSENSDFYMDYYNMDGSKAEMCGNGIRCMSGFMYDRGFISGNRISIDTLAGIKKTEIEIVDGKPGNIKVDMGIPVFKPEDIPVKLNSQEVFGYNLSTDVGQFNINCISMGNPHCIIYIKDSEDLGEIPLESWGPIIENDPIFPNKTNVEFVKIKDKNLIDMRVWERGVGETLACGTGACAAGVSSMKLSKVSGSFVNIKVTGGDLNVLWEGGPSNSVFLEGKVEHTFDGVCYI